MRAHSELDPVPTALGLPRPSSGIERLGPVSMLTMVLMKSASATEHIYVLTVLCQVLDRCLRFIRASRQPRVWFLLTSVLQMSELRLRKSWATVM